MADLDGILGCLKATAEATRLRLLALFTKGELTVTEVTQILRQSQPRVSRHLKLMSEAGLIERIKEGSWVFLRSAIGEHRERGTRRTLKGRDQRVGGHAAVRTHVFAVGTDCSFRERTQRDFGRPQGAGQFIELHCRRAPRDCRSSPGRSER